MQPLLLTTTGQTLQGKAAQVAGVRDTTGGFGGFIDLVAALAGSERTPDSATPKAKEVDATNEPGTSGEPEHSAIQMASLVAFANDSSGEDEGDADTTVIEGLGVLALVPGELPGEGLATDGVPQTLPQTSEGEQPAARLVSKPVPREPGADSDVSLDGSDTLPLDQLPEDGLAPDPERGVGTAESNGRIGAGNLSEVPRQALAGTVPITAETGSKEYRAQAEVSDRGPVTPAENPDKAAQVVADPTSPNEPTLVTPPVGRAGQAQTLAELSLVRSEREIAGSVPGQASSPVAKVVLAEAVRTPSDVAPQTTPPGPALAEPGLRVAPARTDHEDAQGEGDGEDGPLPTVALPGSPVRTSATQSGTQAASLAAAPSGPASPAAFPEELRERGDPMSNGVLPSIEEATKATGPERTRAELPVARSVIQQITHTVSRAPGDGVIEIRLQPEELGRVRLTMVTGEAGLSVQVTAERPETLDLIRRHIDTFESDLRNQGFVGMSFSFGAETSGEQDRREQDARPGSLLADRPGPDTRLVAIIGPSTTLDNGKLDIRI